MFTMNPLISIIMPAFNASMYIEEAILSVLQQTYEHWELIVVDDGSTDSTLHIAQSMANKDSRIKIFHQSNKGGCAARNEALKHILGDYVLYLDADDFLNKDKIRTHLQEIEEHNYQSDVVTFGACLRFLPTGKCVPSSMERLNRDYQPAIEAQITIWNRHFNSFPYSSYLIPIELIRKTGLWDEQLARSQDSEYMARVLFHASELHFIPNAYFYYRQVPDSVSSKPLSNKQLRSEVIVCDKISDLILATNSSENAKHACEVHYTDVLTAWYPQNRFLIQDICSAMRRKGLHLNFENRGKFFHLLKCFGGWRMAVRFMQLKQRIL